MIVVYGDYRHKQNSTGITVTSAIEENDAGVPFRQKIDIAIDGRIHNKSGVSRNLDDRIRELEAAYSIPGQDFGLLHDDGRRSAVWLMNNHTIGGIRPVFLAYPNYKGGEYCTYRQFRIALTATVPFLGPLQYTRFTETLSIDGGGPVFAVKEVNFGRGIRQRIRTHSKCIATQSGSAVGYSRFPVVPPPIWDFALRGNPRISKVIRPRGATRTRNVVLEECEISWVYEYEWTDRLDGIPHYAIG